MKKVVTLSAVAFLATATLSTASTEEQMQVQIDALVKKVDQLEKKQKKQNSRISEVKIMAAQDNIKFGVDFRNAVDVIDYSGKDSNGKDISASNSSLLTSRLYLTMGAAPMDGLIFKGKLAIYSTWGAELYVNDPALKDWAASSKASDTLLRVKEAYFVYSNSIGSQPISFSIGRRPATNGFLANYRENEKTAGSPLAHITNMEVNGAMVSLDWDRYISGAYTKLVLGRAHTGEMQEVYGDTATARLPYALSGGDVNASLENESVDYSIILGNAYDNGQYQVMYEWAHIYNTKGKALNGAGSADDVNKAASGSADLVSLGLKIDGIGDEISDFLDDTTLFMSVAATSYNAKSGHSLLGSADGGTRNGYSYWIGTIFPDMITDSGKFGLEYNHGSSGWTPMTWAEDTAIGSKIAVRGDAYEAYWNFDLFGVKYLPSQVRYTYMHHDYTPNLSCAGWITPTAVDIVAQDLRLSVSYRY